MTKKKKIEKASPIGSAFPNISTSFSGKRLDIKLLEQTASAPPVARSLWQLQLIAFPSFEFKIVPPSSVDASEDDLKELLMVLKKLDSNINTCILCAQAMYDIITYGSAIFEITWTEKDGYIVPDVIQRLPAASFKQAPSKFTGNKERYSIGNILKGIVYDKQENKMSYWQTQGQYNADPVEIPAEQIIHIKDARSKYVDGEPYLAGITSTIAQLEFVRKRLMQTVSRVGSPRQIAKVGIPPTYLKSLETNNVPMPISSAVPGAQNTSADVMLTDLWEYARVIVEGQNADQAIAVPDGIDLQWERPSVPLNPTDIDQYLIREAISHIFPRDILEVISQAISTTSAPLLELLKIMVQGWQSLCSRKFEEELWTKFLDLNGYEGYHVEFVWDDLIPPDESRIISNVLMKFNSHVITLNEARVALGMLPLDPAPWMEGLNEREILEKEMVMWKIPASTLQPSLSQNPLAATPFLPNENTEESDVNNLNNLLSEAPIAFNEKQNMDVRGVKTTEELDKELDKILLSVESDIMKLLSSTKYFDKKDGEE